MCRIIPRLRGLSYCEQLSKLEIYSLRARRLRLYQLITIFKIYTKHIEINLFPLFNIICTEEKTTRGYTANIFLKFANNNYRRDFFTISSINMCNKLPQKAIDAKNLTEFKKELASFFKMEHIWCHRF